MHFILAILLLVPFLNASKFPMFTISGTLTCGGEPIKGNIIMVDDNFAFTDHLLSERKVNEDGKFSLRGEPNDDCLDVKLIVEHRCHDMKFGRGDSKKLKGYSEFEIHVSDLIKSDYKLNMDIELARNKVRISSPVIPAWKAWLYGKRMISDTFDRIKKLKIWGNV
ncbi:hypothetical protein B9Z55_006553 [Caenorhabditis nigoni]|uniref:Uncharacterized protein n=1 Tax=Caenorhabditis nigoni TaxID=1611254 RepID=A0A2G5V5M4_9PELO|nr:hypothetical protein B9Z55_006553 [Caenorhabditis nigoni]